MIKVINVLSLLVALFVVLNDAGAQHHSIRHFNPENGMEGIFVNTTTEDSKGYKWIGTEFGLLRFDGLNFKTMDRNDSTGTNFPTALRPIKSGAILVGYQNGSIKLFNGVKLRSIYPAKQNSSPIKGFIEDKNGTLWALTQNDGIIRFDNEKGELIALEDLAFKKSNVITCYESLVLIGTNEGVLVYQVTNTKELSYLGQSEDLKYLSVLEVVKRPNRPHEYWVGTDNDGLFLMKLENVDGKINSRVTKVNFLQQESILAIREEVNEDLWICTKKKGLVRVNFNKSNSKPVLFTYFNRNNGFPGNEPSTLFLDKDQNLWVGTIGDGLIQVVKKGVIFYNFEKFRARTVNAIAGTTNHDYFFGTDVGLIRGFYTGNTDSMVFELITHPSVKGKNVTTIHVDPNNNIYYATKNGGLFVADPSFEKIKKIQFNHGSLEFVIRQIIQDEKGQLWLSMMYNGVYVIDLNGEIKKHYATKTGFYHNEIYHMLLDRRGNMWFAAHSAGLALMTPDGEIDYLSTKGIFPARDINDISEDENGNIWIGTYGNGIFEYDGTEFIRFDMENGLLSNYCNALISDSDNHIWVSHRTGLSRLDEHTNAISTLEEKDGLVLTEFIHNSIFRDQDHNIWLGNRTGVTFLNSPDDLFESKLLETIVTDIKIDHKSVDLYEFSSDSEVLGKIPTRLKFPYDRNNLTFEYIALNLKKPTSNLYQFKLEGFDREWSPSSNVNSISYTNLNPGTYTFLVRQSDNPNHWGDNITRIEFIITPSFWTTWWFRLLIGIIGFAIIYGIFRYRTQRLHRRLEEKNQFLLITENQNRRLKDYSFITSHNIRASVSNIMGLLGIIEDDPMNKKYFGMLKDSVDKLNVTIQHVNDLLNFENRTGAGTVSCNILEAMNRAIDLNKPTIESSQAKVIINVAPVLIVKANPAYLDSIFNNLLSNALRYGITEQSKKIEVGAKQKGNETIITFRDYGLGIDLEKHKDKLFKLGSRFHTSKSDGNGIGLFMIKNQIEAMGGSIDVKSAENRGTVFKVILPNQD